MWGAAPRFGRLAALLALVAAALLACVRDAGTAFAAPTVNWAAQDSADFDADHLTDFGGLYRGRSPQDGLWYAPATGATGPFQIYFGATTDIPVPGDYDGDGKVPVVPTIPWARTSDIQSCGAGFVAKIQALYTAFPQVVKGPDLWTYFKNNPSLISGDNLHPSTAGYAAFRQQWANAMLTNVYG